MSSPSDGASPPPRQHRRRLLKWTLGGVAALVIVAAICAGLFRIAANLLPRYHARIQQQVSAQLGAPVQLGRISLRWHGLGPELAVRNLKILSASTHRPVITARRLWLDFSLLALFHGASARPSGIRADGLAVTVIQQPDGSFAVAGFSPRGSAGGSMRAMLNDAFSVTDGAVSIRLAGAAPATWTFAPVAVDIGGGYTHSVDISIGMPTDLGGSRLQVTGTVETDTADPAKWNWSARFGMDRLQLAPLRRFLPATAPKLNGTLAFDGTLRGTGARLSGGSGRVAAVELAAGASRIPSLQTRFGVGSGPGYSVTLADPRIVEANGVWEPGTITLARDDSGRLHASIEHLELAALPPLTGFLPARADAVATRLEKMAPAGSIDNLQFAFTPGPLNLDLRAELRDVSVQAALGAPGFEHLSGSVDLVGGSGAVKLNAPDFTLLMPHLFGHPVELKQLSGVLDVAVSDSGLHLASTGLSVSGNGLSGSAKGEIDIPPGGDVHIKLNAKAAGTGLVEAREHYLPHGLLPPPLDRWLMHSFEGGRITGATVTFDGPVRKFPYEHGGGHFEVQFGFAGVTLKPGPQWPPLQDLSGRVTFENAGMHAEISGGNVEGAKVVKATSRIASFFNLHLAVKADIAGQARDFLAFLRASPAGEQLKANVQKVHAEGPTSTQLTLDLPIMHPARFELHGRVRFAGVKIHYGDVPIALDDVRGSATYDRNGPTDGKFAARVAGTPVTLRLSRLDRGHLARTSMDGIFPVASLSKITGADLGRYASGRLPLQVDLTMPVTGGSAPVTVDAYSDLRGFAIHLPAPVGKDAASRAVTQAHFVIRGDTLHADARYAGVLNGCAEMDLGRKRPMLRGLHLVLGVGKCAVPRSGMHISGGWNTLALDPWLAELPKQRGGTKGGVEKFGPLTLDLHFGELRAFAQVFKDESVSGTLTPSQTLLGLDGPDLAGKLSIPSRPTNETPIIVELTRGQFALPQKQGLIVTPAGGTAAAPASKATPASATARIAHPPPRAAPAAATVAVQAAAPARTTTGKRVSPQDIPPFDVHAAHLRIGTAAVNDVLIKARREGDGIVIDPIRVGGGALKLDGTLAWIKPPNGMTEGALRFTGNVSELGKLLTGLGIGPVITGHGAFSAALAWNEPAAGGGGFSDQLLGRVSVDLRDGSISQVSPGAGRLLSLLALANIPRYLVFNFSNLFGKGFPFNRIHGDYVIDKGVATTDGLIIDSSVAWIRLTGAINLPKETIDQKADIVPNYTGSLPVIGALFGGLPVGAAIFAVTKIFGGAIAQATKLQYTIIGPLASPAVKPVGGKPASKNKQPAITPPPIGGGE